MSRRGLAAVTGLLTVAVSLATGVTASATTVPGLSLPKPTGPFVVGTTSLYMNDTSRPDPWVPAATTRELMVSLWYPAKSPNGRTAQYVTPKESEIMVAESGLTGIPSDLLSTMRTRALRCCARDSPGAFTDDCVPLVSVSAGSRRQKHSRGAWVTRGGSGGRPGTW